MISMKIGVPMVIKSKDEKASARFARAEYFAFIDIESKDIEFKINPHTEEAHGAAGRWSAGRDSGSDG